MFFQFTIFYIFLVELYALIWPGKESNNVIEMIELTLARKPIPLSVSVLGWFTTLGGLAYLVFMVVGLIKASTPLSYLLWAVLLFLGEFIDVLHRAFPDSEKIILRVDAFLSISVIVAFIASL
jgi:hypothetical protein